MQSSPSFLRGLLVLGAWIGAAGDLGAQTLNAHPGPSNNGLSAGGAAIFFDLTATSGNFTVTSMTTANSAAANAAFSVEVFT
jgi:hypothetical protein